MLYAALFLSLTMAAQTVSTAYVKFQYCQDTESNVVKNVSNCLTEYTWNNVLFTGDGTKSTTITNARGCDSTINMTVNFVDNRIVVPTNPGTVCTVDLPYLWEYEGDQHPINSAGHYEDESAEEDEYGCPKYLFTLDLQTEHCVPAGAISGMFSVSANKQVYFSKGNLQFCAKPGSNPKNYTHLIYSNTFQQQSGTTTSGGQWRFAEHQYDYVGATTQLADGETNTGNVYVGNTQSCNTSRSSSYSGYIDIFTWGSSSVSMKPWSLTAGNASLYNIDCFDWGYYNSIYYGNNQSSAVSEWRTPKAAEMKYLLKDRHGSGWSANNRMAMGTIEGQNGLILLPDVWTQPAGVPFSDYTNAVATQLSTNVYTASTWQQMEDRGAVFLPCAGRYEWGWDKWGGFNKYGGYWLREYYSSYPSTSEAYYFEFRTTTGVEINKINTDSGRTAVGNGQYTNYSVRLIQDVQ